MPTIQGADGDTTGALVTNITTPEQLTALVLPASSIADGALLAADYDKLAAVTQDQMDVLANAVPSGMIVQAFTTAVVNLMATGQTLLNTPPVNVLYFYVLGIAVEVATRDAALTTDLKWKLAQNGTDFTAAQTLSAATINAAAADIPATFSVSLSPVQIKFMGTSPIQWDITQAVAGVGLTDCTGRVIVFGYYA